MMLNPLIFYNLVEVHGNRTHPTALHRRTGFEVENREKLKTLAGRASPAFRICRTFSTGFPIPGGSWGKEKGQCNQECNLENELDFSSRCRSREFKLSEEHWVKPGTEEIRELLRDLKTVCFSATR